MMMERAWQPFLQNVSNVCSSVSLIIGIMETSQLPLLHGTTGPVHSGQRNPSFQTPSGLLDPMLSVLSDCLTR